MNHISFPKIQQFANVIKQVRDSANWHGITPPVVTFKGTVKLHGTNAAVCVSPEGQMYFQSRERIITPESDNAGFALWGTANVEMLERMTFKILEDIAEDTTGKTIQIYGEWAGGNIQKGVGLNNLEKSFFIFGIRISEDSDSTDWISFDKLPKFSAFIEEVGSTFNTYLISSFQNWTLDIDMNKPTLSQNDLVAITEAVEKDCPVARTFVGTDFQGELVGEGVVWTAVSCNTPELNISDLRFKVKGEKHSSSKVKTIAAVDSEKVKSVTEFVDYACTENRLQQGLDKLREKGLEFSMKSTGDYIKWVVQDILAEEASTLVSSGLTGKEINGTVAKKAKEFFMKAVNSL